MLKHALMLLAAVVATQMASTNANATCQNIQNQTINLGTARVAVRTGPQKLATAAVFTSGDGWGSGPMPRLGVNRTLGYLPPGAVYNAWFTAAVVDNSTASNSCVNARIEAVLSARNGDTCGSIQAGPWTTSYNVNTCALADGVFRGIIQISHQSLGFAPSYFTELRSFDLTQSSSPITTSSGCHKVTTEGGASGCSDPI
jgi:hypothetical protein